MWHCGRMGCVQRLPSCGSSRALPCCGPNLRVGRCAPPGPQRRPPGRGSARHDACHSEAKERQGAGAFGEGVRPSPGAGLGRAPGSPKRCGGVCRGRLCTCGICGRGQEPRCACMSPRPHPVSDEGGPKGPGKRRLPMPMAAPTNEDRCTPTQRQGMTRRPSRSSCGGRWPDR